MSSIFGWKGWRCVWIFGWDPNGYSRGGIFFNVHSANERDTCITIFMRLIQQKEDIDGARGKARAQHGAIVTPGDIEGITTTTDFADLRTW